MKSTKELLIDARALIDDIDRWCQGHNARDNAGTACGSRNVRASCWCADGALIKVSGGALTTAGARIALNEAAREMFKFGALYAYIDVNDGRVGIPEDFPIVEGDDDLEYAMAHANILKVFDRAIEMAEA